MPLLTRMVGTPLTIDIGPGSGRAASRRCSPTGGSPAAATSRSSSGPGWARRSPRRCAAARATREICGRRGGRRRGGRRELARAAARGLLRRAGRASAAAARSTSPSTPPACPACRWSRSRPASPTTASPRRSPRSRTHGRKGSYGVQMPIAVVVDLDYVRRSEPGDAPRGHRRRDLQPVGDRRLAAGRARARRGGRRRRGDVRAHRRDLDRAPRGRDRRRRVPDRARRGARALRAGDGDGRLEPAVQRRRPRDPARDRPPLPGHRAATASWRAPRACSRRSCASDDGLAARARRLPAPPRPAAHAAPTSG